MVQAGYTTDRLLQIGRSNYDRYAFFVKIWNAAVSGSRQDRL